MEAIRDRNEGSNLSNTETMRRLTLRSGSIRRRRRKEPSSPIKKGKGSVRSITGTPDASKREEVVLGFRYRKGWVAFYFTAQKLSKNEENRQGKG